MTTGEAKADLATRLNTYGVTYEKLTAKTVSFEDLARHSRIVVIVHGAKFTRGVNAEIQTWLAAKPRPYSIHFR